MSRILFSVWFSIQDIIQNTISSVWFRIQRIIKNVQGIIQRLVQDSAYYSEMARVLFSVWFPILGIIENPTSSVWFRIQRIIKKCPGYYSAYGSVFSIFLKNVHGIIQRLVPYPGYY